MPQEQGVPAITSSLRRIGFGYVDDDGVMRNARPRVPDAVSVGLRHGMRQAADEEH